MIFNTHLNRKEIISWLRKKENVCVWKTGRTVLVVYLVWKAIPECDY